MKNLILAIVMVAVPFYSFAQQQIIQTFYQKYMEYDNVTDVHLDGWVLKLASHFSGDETAERLLEKITNLRVMVMENGNLVSKADYKKLLKDLQKDRFSELMNIREGTQKVDFYIREQKDAITNVIILVNDTDEFVLLSLEGNLKFTDLHDLNISVEGGDLFKKLPAKKKDIPRA